MRTKTHFMSFAVSQLPVVQFEHVRTLFDSTQSQESKSEISLRKRARQCALLTILCPLLFLSSLWSNLSMWGHFLIVLNLRNPNLRSACAKERGNAHYWPFYVLCCFSAPSGPIWACEDTFWEYSISRIQIWDRLAQKYAAMRTMTHFMAQSVFLVFWVQSRQFLSPFPSLPFSLFNKQTSTLSVLYNFSWLRCWQMLTDDDNRDDDCRSTCVSVKEISAMLETVTHLPSWQSSWSPPASPLSRSSCDISSFLKHPDFLLIFSQQGLGRTLLCTNYTVIIILE